MENCGIYMLYSDIDSRIYIGSSNNLQRRIRKHFYELKINKHHNIHLQRFVNKYGLDNLKVKIINYCEVQNLMELEIKYINLYKTLTTGFNLAYPDNTKRHYTIEQREVISQAIKYSKFNKKINVICNGDIIYTGVIGDIADIYNIDKSSVYKVLKGIRKTHKGFTFTISE